MIKAVILDDEERGSKSLLHKLATFEKELQVLAVFDDPVKALKAIVPMKPDVLFLDVEMPHLNGFQFLEKLGKFDFEVVFTTAYNTYVLEALRVSAVDYLIKPINNEDLSAAIDRLKKRRQAETGMADTFAATPSKRESRLPLPTQQGIYLVRFPDIIRVEAMSNYSTFFLSGQSKIIVSKTLKEYESLLPEDRFMRVNRSVIVNLDFVVKYRRGEGGTLEMSDGSEIEVSPLRKESLLSKLFL